MSGAGAWEASFTATASLEAAPEVSAACVRADSGWPVFFAVFDMPVFVFDVSGLSVPHDGSVVLTVHSATICRSLLTCLATFADLPMKGEPVPESPAPKTGVLALMAPRRSVPTVPSEVAMSPSLRSWSGSVSESISLLLASTRTSCEVPEVCCVPLGMSAASSRW